MKFSRRQLLKSASLTAGAVGALGAAAFPPTARAGQGVATAGTPPDCTPLPPAFASLAPLGDRVRPIAADEYQARIENAQRLMTESEPRFDAIFITPGTTLAYFTGIHWWPSERILALLIPRQGAPLLVSAAFEEGRLRELLPWPIEIRIWQEDDNPYTVASKWLTERSIAGNARVGVEETTRYVFFDGLRHAAPALQYSSADPVTVGCRARKSAHELELMRLACAATFDVYRATFASLREGMSQGDVATLVTRGFAQMNLAGDAVVLFGASAALPHGSRQPQTLREGMGVLIDGGTILEGYHSDVTRTSLIGEPPAKLVAAFEIVRRAQDAALAAAVAGHECGSVDDAARKVINDAGFGPGYKYFAHRLGHGIGLDEHEWPYLVRGNRTILKPGMTFSNEPGIYVVGDYGLRCEDDMVVGDSGPAQLLTPGFAPSLQKPIA